MTMASYTATTPELAAKMHRIDAYYDRLTKSPSESRTTSEYGPYRSVLTAVRSTRRGTRRNRTAVRLKLLGQVCPANNLMERARHKA